VATASFRLSLTHRFGAFVAGTLLAAGVFAPSAPVVLADTSALGGGNPAGLSITIETVDQLTGITAVAVGGGEIPLLEEPEPSASSLATIPDGSVVDLRIADVDTVLDDSGNRWWPATWNDDDGWINGENLTQATTAGGEVVSSTLVPFDYPRTASAHSTAMVFGNGEHVNVREQPSPTSTVVTRAADGQVVSLRIDLVDTQYDETGTRWWPVTVNGIDGWISGFHLADSNDAPTTSLDEPESLAPGATVPAGESPTGTVPAGESPPATSPATSDGGAFDAGDFVQVFTGDGTPVNVRATAAADAAVIGTLNDGAVVEVVSGPFDSDASATGWYEVTAGSLTGFVDGDFLVSSVEAPSGEPPLSTEPPLSEEEEATQRATTTPTEEATTEPNGDETQAPAPTPTPSPQPTAVPTQESSAGFILPLANYTRTQGFGCSNLGFYSYNAEYGCALHNGLDLAAPAGTPILASADGTVVTAGWCNCGLGYYVEIDHGNGVHTLYGHQRQQPSVAAGQQVRQGQQIGVVGSTGISTGPHVHFMVTVNGVARNPENYL
jgi:murein DD-endopeptidase MepM/ murein hydrolase activator NlpD